MYHFMVVFIFVVISQLFVAETNAVDSAFNIEESKERCLFDQFQTEELFGDELYRNYSLIEMEEKFNQVYNSKKRIRYHADYNSEMNSFYLYLVTPNSIIPVRITLNFIKSVTLQIETAIEKGFASYVFLPDMGHAHLNFPLDHWKKEYARFDISTNNMDEIEEKMLADMQMEPLYHLSERLEMLDENGNVKFDEVLNFKYWNRNFFGKNNGTNEYAIYITPNLKKYNTVCCLEGYKSWSSGFSVSASELGCFPYRNKDGNIQYFDISLYDPRYNPETNHSD